MRTALTIAGSDSGAGAGIQADLKTFAAFDVYGASAITAVTAQNTRGVSDFETLPAAMVTAQIEAVVSDIRVDAVKTGMLASAAIVEAVAAAIVALDLPFVVVDPVMVAKSGDHLLSPEAVGALKTELLPRAFVVTPNVPEAEALTGLSIRTVEAAREAAQRLHALGAHAVVVKGGHLPGNELVDVLYDGHELIELRGPRIVSRNTHGTGCTFSAAIAAELARSRSLPEAVAEAKAYVAGAMQHGAAIGHGHRPLNHFWRRHFRAAPGGGL
jgi:hydroxymethylpyrimidine/phosphomethylpyrimidine kinase